MFEPLISSASGRDATKDVNAASISDTLLALMTGISSPKARAAVGIVRLATSALAALGSISKATVETDGSNSRSNSSRFGPSSKLRCSSKSQTTPSARVELRYDLIEPSGANQFGLTA